MTIFKKHALAFTVVLALLLTLAVWEISKYRLVPRHWGVVEQGKVYRSGRLAPCLVGKTLQKYGIKVIVDLTDPEPRNPAWHAEHEAIKSLGLASYHFPLIGDGTGNITNYAKAIAVIERSKKENKKVLVHCAAGTQRTGGVIAAYRLLIARQLPTTVCSELTRYGWKPKKDKILLDYLNAHMSELTAILQAMQVIGREKRSIREISPG
jgi:protein tyrosine phosphatase (PTP) superfamily phosphohydrolase (DUF442 family)